MKKIKILIVFVMVCFLHIINGELFQRHFKYLPSASIHFSFTALPQKEEDEIIRDFCKYAEKNKVEFYLELPTVSEITTYNMNLYCSSPDAVKTYFFNAYGIKEKTYRSIFSGKTALNFIDVNEVPNLYSCDSFYVLGTQDNIKQFRDDLSSNYSISNYQDGFENKGNYKVSITVLCIIGIILFLLTLYELSVNKKQTVISISLGESAETIILKNIITDSLCLFAMYLVSKHILSLFTYTFYNAAINSKIFLAVVLINALLYLKIKWYSFRKAFARNTSDKELLTASYIIKFISTTIIIVVLLPNCIFIRKAISYNSQESFFSQLNDYHYITFGINQNIQTNDLETDLNNSSLMNNTYDHLYRDHFIDGDVKIIMNITSDGIHVPMIYYNKNNCEYLCNSIQELMEKNLESKVYICIPQESELAQLDTNEIINLIKEKALVSLEKLYDYNCEVVVYNRKVNVISIASYLPEGSEILKNPIIILNNIDESKAIISDAPSGSFWAYFRNVMMYKMNESEFTEYMASRGFSPNEYRSTITNVYQDFSDHKALINRELLIVSVITIMLIILQAGIIIVILKLEYQIKSSEYCIKKILGYSSFEINRYIYAHTLINYAAINISLFFIFKNIIMSNLNLYIILQLALFIFEVTVTAIYSSKMNEVNINKILKGGKL